MLGSQRTEKQTADAARQVNRVPTPFSCAQATLRENRYKCSVFGLSHHHEIHYNSIAISDYNCELLYFVPVELVNVRS